MIPKQLQNNRLKFCKIKIKTKKPFEKDWTNKLYSWEEIEKWLESINANYGILCGYGDLAVIDSDNPILQNAVEKLLPETYRVKTGSGGTHNYFFIPDLKQKLILEVDGQHLGEIQSYGTQVVGPNSTHPNGNKYQELNQNEIAEVSCELILNIFKPFMKKQIELSEDMVKFEKQLTGSKIDELGVLDIWGTAGLKKQGQEYYGCHPIHGSTGGMNFWVNPLRNLWHCFRCASGGGVLSAIAVKEGIIDCNEAHRGNIRGKIAKECISIAKSKYGLEDTPLRELKEKEVIKKIKKVIINFFDKKDLAIQIMKHKPFYFDEIKNWWTWNVAESKWKLIDETFIMNIVSNLSYANTINSKERTEIIEALRQESRFLKPCSVEKTWIQFRNKILDIKTGEEFEAAPEYFVCNPIPYKLHNDNYELTPIMDKIFEEWVGVEHIQTLYEIIAYCLLPYYPIHRIFCLIGPGSNGKGCFLRLIEKFLGKENVCSTELDNLLNSRFEISRLHKKLVCLMGETNFNEITKTSMLKKLSGGDLIGFEYKNKNPFEDYNYAKIIIATNNLPTTDDKSIGFYRRWLIIDFPNQFPEKIDILETIPEEEYEALALKCTGILHDLLKNRKFHNEGSIEDRMKKFEEKSNPLDKFLKEFCDSDDSNGFITSNSLNKKFNQWLSENKFRSMSDETIGKQMKQKGFELERVYMDWYENDNPNPIKKRARGWVGIRWK